jgi:hypothetical protein
MIWAFVAVGMDITKAWIKLAKVSYKSYCISKNAYLHVYNVTQMITSVPGAMK